MDQTFCRMWGCACFEVHLMVVDLDRTDQPRQAGPIPSVNGPKVWCMLKLLGKEAALYTHSVELITF